MVMAAGAEAAVPVSGAGEAGEDLFDRPVGACYNSHPGVVPVYAIVETGGKQYRAEEGQVLVVEKLDAEPGQQVELPVVALVDGGRVVTDPGARVVARVLDHVKGRKIIVFKYRAKVNYRRKTGHRQRHTRVRVESIQPAS